MLRAGVLGRDRRMTTHIVDELAVRRQYGSTVTCEGGCGYGDVRTWPMADHEQHYDPDSHRSPLDEYAWPGGYPIAYYTEDGDVFCGRHAWAIVIREDEPMVRDVHWEGPAEWCAEGSHEIPSAYGEDDE